MHTVMMCHSGLCFKAHGYYSGRMDASRKALKAGLQINNKAAMEGEAEAINSASSHLPVAVVDV